jgi:hypothetical protein
VTQTPHPGTREYRHQLVRISDLVVTEDLITDVRFENCQIIGPAVLVLLENTVVNRCQFDTEGADQLFWIVPSTRPSVIGAIGLKGVEFYACRFQRIGIAVPEGREDAFRKGFGLDQ